MGLIPPGCGLYFVSYFTTHHKSVLNQVHQEYESLSVLVGAKQDLEAQNG